MDPILTTKYCTFWIPCITHNELMIVDGKYNLEFPQRQSINDYDPLYKVSKGDIFYTIGSFVEIITNDTKDEETKYIITVKVCAKKRNGKNLAELFSFDIVFTSVEYRHSGLIQFKYSLSETNHQRFYDIKDTIYHQIKNHFHEHYYHTQEASLLKGYYSVTQVDLKQEDNEVLQHYFNQIHNILVQQVEHTYYEYKYVCSLDSNDEDGNSIREKFYENCENILGQFVFYSSLLNSKRNLSCRILPTIDNPNEMMRRLAHNIYNLIDSIRIIYKKTKSTFYLQNIQETNEIQKTIKDISKKNVELIQQGIALNNKTNKAVETIADFTLYTGIDTEEVKKIVNNINSIQRESEKSNRLSRYLGIWSFILGLGSLLLTIFGMWQNYGNNRINQEPIHSKVTTDLDNVMVMPLNQKDSLNIK